MLWCTQSSTARKQSPCPTWYTPVPFGSTQARTRPLDFQARLVCDGWHVRAPSQGREAKSCERTLWFDQVCSDSAKRSPTYTTPVGGLSHRAPTSHRNGPAPQCIHFGWHYKYLQWDSACLCSCPRCRASSVPGRGESQIFCITLKLRTLGVEPFPAGRDAPQQLVGWIVLYERGVTTFSGGGALRRASSFGHGGC